MILKFLTGLNLALLAGLLTLATVSWGADLFNAAMWWRVAKANELEWQACKSKHDILVRQIKKEGLWKRLGMSGQPWL